MIDWSGLFSTSGQTILFRLAAIAVILAVHGFTIALLAGMLGDRGPRHDGRLSLNPLAHVVPIGTIVPLFFRVSWIKPMLIDPALLKGGRWGPVAIVLASLLAMLAMAAAAWSLRPLLLSLFPSDTMALASIGLLENIAELSLWFVALNVLPLPPLTAGLILAGFAEGLHRACLRRTTLIAAGLALLAALGILQQVLGPMVAVLRQLLLR